LKCNRVLLCTKPLDAVHVLSEISDDLQPDTHLVSIAACLPIEQISRFFSGGITRVVPSLTGEMSSGVTLLCHNSAVTHSAAQEIEELFRALGNVVVTDEENFEVASDLTSCGPALIAVLIEEFSRCRIPAQHSLPRTGTGAYHPYALRHSPASRPTGIFYGNDPVPGSNPWRDH